MMRHLTGGCGQLCAVVPDFCPACGRPGGEWEEVAAAATEAPPDAPPAPADPPPAPADEPLAPPDVPGWTCTRCERPNGDAGVVCVECGAPRAGSARCLVSGDAGVHVLTAGGQLVVGRSPHSTSASSLAAFDNVSWVQAVVSFGGDGGVTVIDLDSTNGTWAVHAGGRRQLPPLVPTRLGEGESLQFGNDPSGRNAVVEICVEVQER